MKHLLTVLCLLSFNSQTHGSSDGPLFRSVRLRDCSTPFVNNPLSLSPKGPTIPLGKPVSLIAHHTSSHGYPGSSEGLDLQIATTRLGKIWELRLKFSTSYSSATSGYRFQFRGESQNEDGTINYLFEGATLVASPRDTNGEITISTISLDHETPGLTDKFSVFQQVDRIPVDPLVLEEGPGKQLLHGLAQSRHTVPYLYNDGRTPGISVDRRTGAVTVSPKIGFAAALHMRRRLESSTTPDRGNFLGTDHPIFLFLPNANP